MSVIAVVGLQWGDEGKGKIVDVLGEKADIVVRGNGGDNAGHTVVVRDDVFKLHLLPSGAVRENVQVVIGNGAVVNPLTLCNEIDQIEQRGLKIMERLLVSDRAHVLLPFHRSMDALKEKLRGKSSLGTTQRGIGPCYTDKISRVGLRWHQVRDLDRFTELLRNRIMTVNAALAEQDMQTLDIDKILAELLPAVTRLQPCICDTVEFLQTALDRKRNILLEGAQGAMLDIDFGTYPYLTSSNTTVGGLCTGTGIPPTAIKEIHGVLKAFTTRVGAGPFPTEQEGAIMEALRGSGANQWDEFGTTTGRPRRCGWLDLVAARYSARINGLTHLHITKLDVLSQLDEIKVCTGYMLNRKLTRAFPASLEELELCTPEYTTLAGWKNDLGECGSLTDLPASAREYVELLGRTLGASIASASFGPARRQTIFHA